MARVSFFIDGFNLYHALDYCPVGPDHYKYRKFKWLNLKRLVGLFVGTMDTLGDVLYFSAIATWDQQKAARHRLFIRAQENEGVTIVYGEFKRKEKRCPACKTRYTTFEEKQTDVNIALQLFHLAIRDGYDRAVIISGDTDLIPAIKAVRATFPSKQIGVIVPIGRSSEDLKKHSDFRFKMRERHLASSRFPDTITLADGSTLECPATWK